MNRLSSIRQTLRRLEFQLDKAEHGMGMPYNRENVLALQKTIEDYRLVADLQEQIEARKALMTSDGAEQ